MNGSGFLGVSQRIQEQIQLGTFDWSKAGEELLEQYKRLANEMGEQPIQVQQAFLAHTAVGLNIRLLAERFNTDVTTADRHYMDAIRRESDPTHTFVNEMSEWAYIIRQFALDGGFEAAYYAGGLTPIFEQQATRRLP